MPPSAKPLLPQGRLSLLGGRRGENALGESGVALLEHIAATGSITHAAKAAGISYRTAWNLVDRINALSGTPVVDRSAGGNSGGGTRLTEYGANLLKAYQVLREEHGKYVEGLRRGIGDLDQFLRITRRMSLKTSARNQLFGTVVTIRKTALEAEVSLALESGDRLVARITRRSLDDLGIRKGDEIYALIKVSWVTLSSATARSSAKGSTNVLSGRFEEIRREKDRSEAVIRLSGGAALSAAWVGAAARGVRPEPGEPVLASIDPANIILGVN